MSTNFTPHSRKSATRLLRFIVIFFLATGFAAQGNAQSNSATKGYTPSGITPGSPAGSYALSGFDTINPYNGGLNFSLPIRGVGGRGEVGYTIPVQVEQKWTAIHDTIINPETSQQWDFWWPDYNRWGGFTPGYGPGTLQGRQTGSSSQSCTLSHTWETYYFTLTRLTFITPDGTEFELRDQATGGQPATVPYCTPLGTPGASRGTVFVTADGTAATFISDTTIHDEIGIGGQSIIYPSGYLMLRDGTRYRITDGNVTWMRDRNGNKLTFNTNGGYAITDSLGRQITIDYEDVAPYGACDKIIFKGFGGAERIVRVCRTNLGSALRTGYQLRTPLSLFPELFSGSNETPHDPLVTSAVWLPDSDGVTRKYQLRYNSYGELARVELPTGGAFEYDWAAGATGGPDSGVIFEMGNDPQIYRRIIERREYPDGGTGSSYASKMTYSRPEHRTGGIYSNAGYVELSQYDNAGVLQGRTRHHYFGSPTASLANIYDPTAYPHWTEGREYRTESLDSDGETVLSRVDNNWQQGVAVSAWAPSIANNPRIMDTTTTVEPLGANLVSKQEFAYDDSLPFNNKTDVYEYDFGVGAPGGLLRRSHTDFVTASSYVNSNVDPALGPHLRSLSSGGWVSIDAAGINKVSLSSLEYDNYSDDARHKPLVARAGITGHDAAFAASFILRGNVTGVTSYANAVAQTGPVTASTQYDVAGNSVASVDGREKTSTIGYSDSFCNGTTCGGTFTPNTFAFATSNTSPVPDPSGQHASSTALVNTSIYDFWTRHATSTTDANNQTTTIQYNDVLDRPTQVSRAVGTGVANQATFDYDDANHIITTTSDLNSYNDNVIKSETLYDGLGRTTETKQYEGGSNYIVVKKQYDALGRAFKTFNPFRPWQSEIALWTTTAFDALGRPTTVTAPDGSQVLTEYSGSTTGVLGTGVTVTDQAGRKRRSLSDALGRLRRVDEPDSSNNLGSISAPNQSTSYGYDVLDSLVTVSQGTQTRTFIYDSLKRLTSATNPESGTICYGTVTAGQCQANGYDNNGNLTQKTDGRGIVSTFAYDALNRNTTVDYSHTTLGSPDVPDITRIYDGATNGKGRLMESYAGGNATVGTTAEHTRIQSYDPLGLPLDHRQRFKSSGVWTAEYQTQRAYNLAGAVTSQTYPSGRIVSYAYDNAGRTSSFTGNLADGTSRTYSTGIIYSPMGGMTKEQFGTDTAIYNKSFYNSRGQLSEIQVSTSYTGSTDTTWNRGAIINHYSNNCWGMCGGSNSSTPMLDNNGNLQKQDVYIPLNDQLENAPYTTWWQGYDYDNLNRLQRVHEYTGNTTRDWQQENVFDRYGNRTIHQTNTWGPSSGSLIPKPSFEVQTGTNRLYAPGDLGLSETQRQLQYDDAGNLKKDAYSGAGDREYDAENRITKAWANGQWQYYTYNADGRRVRRKVNGVETLQVYGMDGELLAEYAAIAAPATSQKEYGYRNGRLLIEATVATNGGSAPVLHDNPLVVAGTTVQSRHITELQDAINALRMQVGMTAFSWQQPAATGDWIKADPILEMRTALDQALGAPAGGYSAGLAQSLPIKAIHIQELRDRVLAAWNAGSALQVNWLVTDQLGTPRMILDKTGSLANVKRHDYLPFGEELFAGQGGRTAALGYAGDNIRQKFTSKERDNETGLDYFLARYYSSTQGRFTSPDEFSGGPDELFDFAEAASANPTFYADLGNPQSLNKYQYTYNNPTNLWDDDGHCLPFCAAAAAAAAGAYILLSPKTIHAPTPNDSYRESPPDSGVQIVSLGFAQAAGGPIISKIGGAITAKIGGRVESGVGTEVVERAMSKAELKATRDTGLVRGGREGVHHVTNSVSKSATKAQQRLGLKTKPEVGVQLEVGKGVFSKATRVQPGKLPDGRVLPGGGLERKATGNIPAKVIRVRRLDKE